MSELSLVPNHSVAFVQFVEESEDGVEKGKVDKVGKNGQYYLSYGEVVVYNVNDILMRFTDTKSGHKMHAVFYYKIIGKYEEIKHRKKAVEYEKTDDGGFSFKGCRTL